MLRKLDALNSVQFFNAIGFHCLIFYRHHGFFSAIFFYYFEQLTGIFVACVLIFKTSTSIWSNWLTSTFCCATIYQLFVKTVTIFPVNKKLFLPGSTAIILEGFPAQISARNSNFKTFTVECEDIIGTLSCVLFF